MNRTVVILSIFLVVFVIATIVLTSYVKVKHCRNINDSNHDTESNVHFLVPDLYSSNYSLSSNHSWDDSTDINTVYSIDLKQYPNGLLTYMDKRYFAFFILSGGLGDILRYLFASGVGKMLTNMKNPALVFFNTHNNPESMKNLCQQFPLHHGFHCLPYSENLFATYGTLSDMKQIGDCFTNRMQSVYNILYTNLYHARFEVFSYDKDFINQSQKSNNVEPYVVLHRCAGTRDRDIPIDVCRKLVTYLNNHGIKVVHIGKNYDRSFVPSWSESLNERYSDDAGSKYDVPVVNKSSMYVYNVDKLSIVDSRRCILHSCGVITPFSSTSLVAMEFDIPVLTIVMLDLAKHINMLHFTEKTGDNFWGGLEYVNSPDKFRYSLLNIQSDQQKEFVKGKKAHISIDFTSERSIDKALQHLYHH